MLCWIVRAAGLCCGGKRRDRSCRLFEFKNRMAINDKFRLFQDMEKSSAKWRSFFEFYCIQILLPMHLGKMFFQGINNNLILTIIH